MSNNCSHDDYDLNLPFTLERHLNNFREHDTNAQKLTDSFHIIRDNMKQNLKSVIMMFPHYSDHSHEHSENIISSVERLLGRKRIEKLSPSDTWMLMVCAYMHDLGMLIQGKELENDWNSESFQNYLENCKDSSDDSLKQAARHVSGVEWLNPAEKNWSVSVYRDVILLASEFYRRKHPERSKNIPMQSDFGKYFNVVISGDGRLPPRIQDVIGKICFSHGIDFEEILNILEPVDSLFGYEFHPRFIAVMLCLGDLCDLDNGRFNKVSMEVFGELTKNNYVHYYKHESVNSFVLKKDLIAVNFDIKSKRIKQELQRVPLFSKLNPKEQQKELQDVCDRILLETQNWLGWIEELVKNIKLHWDKLSMEHIETFSPSLTYKILVDGNETVSSKKNMRFSFSNEKAYELIESYSLYNNRFVFIRELLQNSVDALKRRFWTDIKSGRWDHFLQNAHKDKDGNIDYQNIQPFDFSDISVFDYYKVFMKIEHQPEEKTARFTIEDNGTGISKEDLQERILRTGMRGRDKTVEEMPDWLRPTSSFGIGLHSVFGVSDSIFIRTRTSPDQPVYNINMHSSRDDGYVFLSLADDQNMKFCHSLIGPNMDIDINVGEFEKFEKIGNKYVFRDMTEERPESDFCNRVQQELKDCLGKSLFDISYQFNEDNVIPKDRIKDDDNIKLLFDETKRNHIFDEPFDVGLYDFALSEDGLYCALWDRKEKVLMVYDIEDIYGYYYNKNIVRACKGFRVRNAPIYNTFIPMYTDYWGGNTKDILNVSRNSLSHQQLEKNKTIFYKSSVCLANIYYEVLKSDELKKSCDICNSNHTLRKAIHLMLWAGVDISPLEESIRTELSSLDGYNASYGFEDKNNFGDIIFSDELKILYYTYSEVQYNSHGNGLRFLKERKINKIALKSEKNVQIIYGKEYNKRDTVVYEGESAFAIFLNINYGYGEYSYYDDNGKHKVQNDDVPVPFGFEDIAVRSMAAVDIFNYARTYMTYLWGRFRNIKKAFAERIKNGEEIEKMADEIVPVSRTDKKPATNVLRNICYDRAFNQELPYDEAWKKVRDTYREFVIKVLNAVKWLLDNGYNEEMEEQ